MTRNDINGTHLCDLQSTAIDVVAIGMTSGAIIIHNLKKDKTILKFKQVFVQNMSLC